MDKKNWIELASMQTQVTQVLETNAYADKYGLVLSKEDAAIIVQERVNTLKQEQRIELGQSILPKIAFMFCDSSYIMQENYRDSLIRLQEIFFAYKNEMMDEITDDELLEFMREQFEEVCYGDFDYLEGTCLEQEFLEKMDAGYVAELLQAYCEDYETLSENICEIVLQNMLGHLILDKPLEMKGFTKEELEELKHALELKSQKELEKELTYMVQLFIKNYYKNDSLLGDYLTGCILCIAVRMQKGAVE